MTPFHHVWSFKRRTGLLWSLNCKEDLSVAYTSQGEWGYFGAEHRFITPSMLQWHLLMWLNVLVHSVFIYFVRKPTGNLKFWSYLFFPTFYSHNSTGCNNGFFSSDRMIDGNMFQVSVFPHLKASRRLKYLREILFENYLFCNKFITNVTIFVKWRNIWNLSHISINPLITVPLLMLQEIQCKFQ